MTQAAFSPSTRVISGRRRSDGWLSPALSGALLISVSFHAVPVIQAIRDLVDLRTFIGEARTAMHDFLWATYEVEPPPPPKEEKPKEPEPEPPPEPEAPPAPKPVVQPQTKPDAPKDTKPEPPKAEAAQAGKTLVAAADVADFSNDFTMIQGTGANFAGGTTMADGTSKDAVRNRKVGSDGVPQGTGSAPAAAPPPPSNEPDRSRPARPTHAAWSYSHLFPAEADAEGIDNATVQIAVTIRADGSAQSVKILNEQPAGNGFGRAARTCALSQRYEVAFDRAGQPIAATTAPFTVRFTR